MLMKIKTLHDERVETPFMQGRRTMQVLMALSPLNVKDSIRGVFYVSWTYDFLGCPSFPVKPIETVTDTRDIGQTQLGQITRLSLG